MGLRDEAQAVSTANKPVRCYTCRYLHTLTATEQAEWTELFDDATVPTSAIRTMLNTRGNTFTEAAVRNHRFNHGS